MKSLYIILILISFSNFTPASVSKESINVLKYEEGLSQFETTDWNMLDKDEDRLPSIQSIENCNYMALLSTSSDPWVIYRRVVTDEHEPHLDYKDEIVISLKEKGEFGEADKYNILVNNNANHVWSNTLADGRCYNFNGQYYYMIKTRAMVLDGCEHVFHIYEYTDEGYNDIVFDDHSLSMKVCYEHGHNDDAMGKGAFARLKSKTKKIRTNN